MGEHFADHIRVSHVLLVVKNPPVNEGESKMRVQSLGLGDPLEKGMATQSSILAYKIPCMRSLEGYSPWRSQSRTQMNN